MTGVFEGQLSGSSPSLETSSVFHDWMTLEQACSCVVWFQKWPTKLISSTYIITLKCDQYTQSVHSRVCHIWYTYKSNLEIHKILSMVKEFMVIWISPIFYLLYPCTRNCLYCKVHIAKFTIDLLCSKLGCIEDVTVHQTRPWRFSIISICMWVDLNEVLNHHSCCEAHLTYL